MIKVKNNYNLEVKTYSGFKSDERPLSFMFDGQKHDIEEIVDSWIGEDHDYWKVVSCGKRYLLKKHRANDTWELAE